MWFLAIAVPLFSCLGGAIGGSLPEDTKARYAKSYYRWFRWSVYLNLCGWAVLLATMLWLPEFLMHTHDARMRALEASVETRTHDAIERLEEALLFNQQWYDSLTPKKAKRR